MNRKNGKYQYSGLEIWDIRTPDIGNRFENYPTSSFLILLVCYGFIQFQANQQLKYLSAHELLVLPVTHTFKIMDLDSQGLIYIILFTPEFVFKNSIKKPHMGLFEFLTLGFSKKVKIKNKEVCLLSALIRLMIQGTRKPDSLISKGEVLRFKFNLLLYEVLEIYYKTYASYFRSNGTGKEKLVIRFLDLLCTNYKTRHSVLFYAEKLSVTPGHLSKILKEVTGKSVKQHIDEAVLAQAKFLLQNNALTIGEISAVLHFQNVISFNRFFKRHSLLSPSEYCRKMTFK